MPAADWTNYSYSPTAGADVSGGVTFQLAIVCGGAPDCSADVFIDNVTVTLARWGNVMTTERNRNSQHFKLGKRVVAMANSRFLSRGNRIGGLLALVLLFSIPLTGHAQVHDVQTYRSEQGWKLLVDGEDFFVKGIVWGYSPRGQNYSYNLWGESDDFIRKVLDYDMGLLKLPPTSILFAASR